ncbi:MAG: pyrroline-5-carboxylate reductase [Oscillospiraceae bacterium]|nr:pyrroline-5-carboxylate reductase [Oscillospiraceae bacterium]
MKYGFIGCGNMGSAIAKALAQTTSDIALTDRSGNAKKIAADLGCIYTDTFTIANECDRIFLAVKPQMMADVLAPIQQILQLRKPMLITMAAGLKIERIESLAGVMPIVRIMPNTPVSVGKGMIPYCCNQFVQQEDLDNLIADLQFVGKMDALDEKLIDVASALSGSGPAYMYLFLEALADGAVACGMPRKKAMEYAAMTMAGAAEMVLSSGEHPGVLKDAVCSPGGSTIVGVKTLEEHGFRGAVMDCVIAAYQKNIELGK